MDLAAVETEQPTIVAELGQAEAFVSTLIVNSQPTHDQAVGILKEAKKHWTALEAQRTDITRPLLEVKRKIDGLFKARLDILERCERLLKDKIATYQQAVEAERRAIMAASAAALVLPGPIPEAATAIVPEPVQAEGVNVREAWDFEIADASAVPRELCSPDPAKIRAFAKNIQSPHVMHVQHGICFFRKNIVTVRK